MKYLLALLLTFPAMASDWTRQDTITEASYLALHTMDWLQTLEIREPGSGYYETNKFLGRSPSRGEVNRYFIATGIAHVIVAKALPPRARHWFQGITIAMEAGYVGHNHSIGVRIKF